LYADLKPLVLSTGGLICRETAKAMGAWEQEFGTVGLSRMKKEIIITLLQTSTRHGGR
jgi:hypothetical protein